MSKELASVPEPNSTPEAQATDAAAPALARIEHKLDGIETRLKHVEAQTTPAKQNPAHTGANKATVAATFALIGFKLGAFFLGKIGFLLVDHPRAYRRGGVKAVGELWSNMITFGGGKKPEHLVGDYKYMAIGLATGSILGPIVAGAIGWMRGDRLEKPGDLFTHPIDSLGKIFGPPPKKDMPKERGEAQASTKPQAGPPVQINSEREYSGTVSSVAEHART